MSLIEDQCPLNTGRIDTSLTVVRGLAELMLQDLPADPRGLGASLLEALDVLERDICEALTTKMRGLSLVAVAS